MIIQQECPAKVMRMKVIRSLSEGLDRIAGGFRGEELVAKRKLEQLAQKLYELRKDKSERDPVRITERLVAELEDVVKISLDYGADGIRALDLFCERYSFGNGRRAGPSKTSIQSIKRKYDRFKDIYKERPEPWLLKAIIETSYDGEYEWAGMCRENGQ